MKTLKLNSLLLILLLGLFSINSYGQSCLNFNNMTAPIADYNNDSIYPIGSTLLTTGDIKMIKTKTGSWSAPGYFEQTTFNSVSSSQIFFHGYLTFDVSSASYQCRELSIDGTAAKIIIGNDTINTVAGFNPYNGNGFVVDTLVGGGYIVTGTFNTVTIWIPTGLLNSSCLNNCAVSVSCLDYRNLIGTTWPGNIGYNNDSLYPAGSTILSGGGVKIIKTYTTGNWNPPYNTYFTASTDTTFDVNGYITLDVSSSTYSCKELTFTSLYGRPSPFIVDGDTIPNTANPYTGNGFNMNAVGNTFTVTGSFNSILLFAPNLGLGEICLESCVANNGCFDLNASTFTDTPTNYTNDGLYPVGSPFITLGDIKVIKTKTGAWMPGFQQSTINQINANDILYHGFITFDVSSASYVCRELTITGYASQIIIGNDTIATTTGFAPYNGAGFVIDTVSGGYKITGTFNSATLFAQTSIYSSVCLDSCASNNSGCLDFNLMTAPVGDYNNDGLYPAGSTLLTSGDLKLIKTKTNSPSPGPWNLTNIIYVNPTDIGFNGYLTLDVSAATYSCRELIFNAIAYKIIIGNDTLTQVNGKFSPYTGSSYAIDTIPGGGIKVTGTYNAVTIWIATGIVYDACLNPCSTSTGTCFIANDLDSSKVNSLPGGYNDNNTYPAGSVLATQNNINFIKTFNFNGPSNAFTQFLSLSNGQLIYWGAITLDVSASNYTCKKITIRASGGGNTKIYADNDTLLTRNGYTVTQIAFNHYEIQGTFNTVTFSDMSTSFFESACLEDCSISSSACIDFQDTTLFQTIPTNQSTYGTPWYMNNGVSFSSKYFDYTTFNNPGEVFIGDHITAGYTGSNGSSNYAGNIFYQGNVITQIDFSAIAINPKKIEFDVNYVLNNSSVNPYFINGQPLNNLPGGVTYTAVALTNGFHITITGNVNTIEIHGFEVGVDNLCVDSLITTPPPSSACIDFQDTTLFQTIPTNQSAYGTPWYMNNGVSFSSKYFDYTTFNNPGEVVIGDHITAGYTGSNGSSNYAGNIFYQGNVVTQIDFTAIAINPKKIEFDVNYILNNSSVNPYFINGQPLNNLPAGVTYTAAALTNGFHITITGNVNTIEIHGFEVGVDNLCVDSAVTVPCNNFAGFTYTITPNGVVFTNTSSSTSTSANQFQWDFGDGSYSSSNDPTHTYANPGTYWVCLTIVDFSCPTNPTMQYCDSVTVGGCSGGHRIITPNGDGEADEVFIPSGSKIYDRNGFLVKSIKQDMNWKGDDDSNRPLPMGYYTITCGNGDGVFNVTIVK